jgi:hypothetical protein
MRFLPRFELSATQLLATALAAITATVAASFLGVTGTVIGAALASVVSAIGTAVYSHSLRSTQARVREAVPVRRRAATDGLHSSARLPVPGSDADECKPGAQARRPSRWHGVAIGSLALFVTVLTLVTGVEIVTGRPLSDLVRGDAGSGTTVFGTANDVAGQEPAPAPTVTRTVTPAVVVVTPTVTRTAPAVTAPAGSRTTAPTVAPTPAPPATPTGTSSAPSATPGSSDQPTP